MSLADGNNKKNSYRDTDRNTNVDIDIKTELLKDIFRMG